MVTKIAEADEISLLAFWKVIVALPPRVMLPESAIVPEPVSTNVDGIALVPVTVPVPDPGPRVNGQDPAIERAPLPIEEAKRLPFVIKVPPE